LLNELKQERQQLEQLEQEIQFLTITPKNIEVERKRQRWELQKQLQRQLAKTTKHIEATTEIIFSAEINTELQSHKDIL